MFNLKKIVLTPNSNTKYNAVCAISHEGSLKVVDFTSYVTP
jgi:hypothetical protein